MDSKSDPETTNKFTELALDQVYRSIARIEIFQTLVAWRNVILFLQKVAFFFSVPLLKQVFTKTTRNENYSDTTILSNSFSFEKKIYICLNVRYTIVLICSMLDFLTGNKKPEIASKLSQRKLGDLDMNIPLRCVAPLSNLTLEVLYCGVSSPFLYCGERK